LLLNWGALDPGNCRLDLGALSGAFPALCLVLSLVSMHFVKDKVGGSEVILKLGYLCDLSLLLLAAAFLDWYVARYTARNRILILLLGALIAPAFVTWMMDVCNTQDV